MSKAGITRLSRSWVSRSRVLSRVFQAALFSGLTGVAHAADDTDELINDILGTYYGDADLNRQVDSQDLALLAAAFDQPGTWGWANGDFNGDQQVDLLDLTILGSFWGSGVAAADQVALSDALVTVGLVAVPEPGSLVVIVGIGMFAIRRRRSVVHRHP